ncbi:hypothetical protein Neosp_000485 [[Neocosmospora] mangrovei]
MNNNTFSGAGQITVNNNNCHGGGRGRGGGGGSSTTGGKVSKRDEAHRAHCWLDPAKHPPLASRMTLPNKTPLPNPENARRTPREYGQDRLRTPTGRP